MDVWLAFYLDKEFAQTCYASLYFNLNGAVRHVLYPTCEKKIPAEIQCRVAEAHMLYSAGKINMPSGLRLSSHH